ncbi:MAG TPA: hypothetical protein DEB17_02935 [Chlorobaculum sp.]|uniref:Uncharacterized protein n=1 Tax=Chlorobaculum tepidum (strain ATCC 49652 / DSM 12025 / NBRC 103806 / TLS) TaxID=194439 RepID=Q8KEA1_CHLTE|nr:hypothetical protein CT0788 [Chlorobaculum tepidum TLS]HBU22944.1 hypothetical protein [Chlorobaculum sp.]
MRLTRKCRTGRRDCNDCNLLLINYIKLKFFLNYNGSIFKLMETIYFSKIVLVSIQKTISNLPQ